MKRLYALLAGISLLSAACGSSSESSGTAASAASAATTPATDAPSTEAPPAAAPAAPVVPSVVCIQFNFDVYFAYDNQSTSVVAVDAADSVVAGGDPADEPLATTLFAPGTVSPAFLVQAGGPPESISWQLTGPDGIVRTATPDADTPSCTPELLEPTTPEPRTPGFTTSAVLNDAGDTVELTLELTGVPPTSVCNAAFTAEPAQIQLQQAQGMDEPLVFEGTTATLTGELFTSPSGEAFSRFDVAVFVLDVCGHEGATSRSWALGDFTALWGGVSFCARPDTAAGGANVVVTEGDTCGGPPGTGGSRIRVG